MHETSKVLQCEAMLNSNRLTVCVMSEMYTHLSAAISGSTRDEWTTMLHRMEEV